MLATTYPELSSWYFSVLASLVLVYGLPFATAGVSAVTHWAHARSAQKRAHASRHAVDVESATLDVGDTIIHGRVEYAAGNDSAMRVVIEQAGTEAESSGSWTVTWTETRRSIEVAPFYVVHASGERVRVEPSGGAQLVTWMPGVERVDGAKRTRLATISPDASVWVTGVLKRDHDPEGARDYRGSAGWVMRPGRQGMIVSTEPPELRLVSDAARSRAWMIVFAILLGVMLLAHLQYHALVLFGRTTAAEVTGTDMGSCASDDEGLNRCSALLVKVHVGHAFDDTWEVTGSAYSAMGRSTGKTLPAFAYFGPFSMLSTSLPGDAPLALVWPTLVTTVCWLGLAFVAFAVNRPKRWYDGAPVNDSVSGRLTVADRPERGRSKPDGGAIQ